MGLFSKKKLYTSTQVMHMVEDTPNILTQSVINSIMKDTEIVPDILDNVSGCLASKTNNYHNYAAKEFTNRLPEGSIGYESIPTSKITDALNQDRPPKIGYKNLAIGVIISEFRCDNASFDYLNKTQSTWNSIDESWEETINGFKYTYYFSSAKPIDNKTIELTYYYKSYVSNPNGGSSTETNVYKTLNFTVAEYSIEPNEEYYIAEYTVVNLLDATDISEPFYWQYQISSKVHPELDVSTQKYSYFMPVVPIRINNVDYTSDNRKDTELYKTSIKLLNKLKVDFLQLGEGINASPDIGEVDHAYFLTGVNPKSNKDGVAEYLYQFFSDMELHSVITKKDFNDWFDSLSNSKRKYYASSPPLNYIDINDETYKTTLSWYYTDRKIVKGSIGKLGSVTKEIIGNNGNLNIQIGGSANGGGYHISMEHPNNCIILRKQIDELHYQELTVSGLVFYNNIYATDASCISTLKNDDGNEIIIPINVDIIRSMNKLKANSLMYDALIVVINSYKWVKLKWYQTGFFKIVVAVVAVAITIISYGGLSAVGASLVALASASATVILTTVLQFVITQIVIAASFKFAAEHLGIEVALVLSIIAMCYGFGSGEIGIPDLPFADKILQAGIAMVSAVQDVTVELMQDITSAMQSFVSESEEQLEHIQSIQKELNPILQLDPLELYTGVGMLPRETSSEYINRTLSFPTMNTVGLQSISSYVDNKLNLDNF